MEYCKKLYSWDIYGVRMFPFRGKRKYTPGVHQTFNGTIIIENDVFGLTILQFEREFKACLNRRKQHEQRIMNIRFPDKTTNEYLQYLKYGDDTVEGTKSILNEMLTCNLLQLVNTAGTELEIRTRQRMYSIIDKIVHKLDHGRRISSGSLAEGLDLPGSDIDEMVEIQAVTVIDNLKYFNTSIVGTVLLVEYDTRHPGFCKLKLIAGCYYMPKIIWDSLKVKKSCFYISMEKFKNAFSSSPGFKLSTNHGPCFADSNLEIDFALCFRSKFWPQIAYNWIHRHRPGQWPMEHVIDSIVHEGCLFVPIGPKNVCDDTFWRISFSLAEKRLTHSFNYTQLLCYVLLKLTLKNIINRINNANDLLCSYFLKTTVFWLSEEIPIDTFNINNLSYCFSLCIDKLMYFVRNCYCPNYFIPQHNLFISKVDESNNKLLFSILGEVRRIDFKILLDRLLEINSRSQTMRTFTDKNLFSEHLDFLFFRATKTSNLRNIEDGYTTLHFINLLLKTESSEFILGVLRCYHGYVNKQISQMLVLPEHSRERNNIIRRCKKHLMDGTKTDAVSGWLLYASFYYVLGDYKKTIQIVDNVLCRCTPDMIILSNCVYTTEEKNIYKKKTDRHLTLNQRMRQGTIRNVNYEKQSTLIPQELQLEVQDKDLFLNPVVLSHFLHYLSYAHLHDNNNRERAFRELYLTIKEGYFMDGVTLSSSSVLLGICYEMSGDRDTAYHYYNEALQCKYICCSAEQWIANLFST